MNKRIQELDKQAKIWAMENATFPISSHIPSGYITKFAELIVKECIREIGYKSVELLDIDFYPHYQERLKKRFGVEE